MALTLPESVEAIRDWAWSDYAPYFDELLNRELTEATIDEWMRDWSRLSDLVRENFSRARTRTTQDTADEEAEAYLKHLLVEIQPPLETAENALNKKLVTSGLQPENFALPLRKIQVSIDLFREENLQLNAREQGLAMEYSKITGRHVVQWDGEEITLLQLKKVLEETDRDRREAAWRLTMDRWMQDREAINALWVQLFEVRQQTARNADFDDYRAYRWQYLKRFDYTPEDALTFHQAIEEVVVPAVERVNERRRQRLGLETLRPWDLDVDTSGKPPLRPWQTIDEFSEKAEMVFGKVGEVFGDYYGTMRREELLDLPNRKNKGPGAYCTGFPYARRPFIFMNAVGTRNDVRTLLHEAGHAFHGFEVMDNLPYSLQRAYPTEFAEVASMAMELLAAPYLVKEAGGYFTTEEAARDRIEHLEEILIFWPYMAIVDAFQHWAYTSGDAAADPANCDAQWAALWDRFNRIDYSGLDEIKATGWHRKLHIYRYPFYYIEYGLARLGSLQVWANSLKDQQQAIADYRRGLALGGTGSLPELFGAAGARFGFDAGLLQESVDLVERTIDDLHTQLV
ncbi:MAG: M3 family oligoendopeptidase [Anaerolineae bacterium]